MKAVLIGLALVVGLAVGAFLLRDTYRRGALHSPEGSFRRRETPILFAIFAVVGVLGIVAAFVAVAETVADKVVG